MSLSKLRSLQEQASPGPWHWTKEPGDEHQAWFEELVDVDGEAVISPFGGEGGGGPWASISASKANAKLAALAPHLLPIAEALEAMHATALLTDTTGHDCAKNLSYPPCKALKELEEALGD